MKVGFISDLHANLDALNAVFEDLPSVDLWVCAGDVVGYYADANEVCRVLRAIGVQVARGNHDAYVTGGLQPRPEKRSSYRTDWTRQNLEPEHLAWLESLPTELVFEWGDKSIRVRHASPWDEETYVYPDSAHLEKIALDRGEVLILGHTHYPMLRKCGEGVVVNPGSVGQPRDWNPKASYALLDTESGDVEFRRVSYDVSRLQQRLEQLGWDSTLLSVLSRTRQPLEETRS